MSLETMTVKELRSRLEWLLEGAVRRGLSYTDFLRLLAIYSHPSELDFVNFHDILTMIKSFSGEAAKAPDNLPLMRRRAEGLVKKGYKPFLVDCFGLPEVYEVYAKVTKERGRRRGSSLSRQALDVFSSVLRQFAERVLESARATSRPASA